MRVLFPPLAGVGCDRHALDHQNGFRHRHLGCFQHRPRFFHPAPHLGLHSGSSLLLQAGTDRAHGRRSSFQLAPPFHDVQQHPPLLGCHPKQRQRVPAEQLDLADREVPRPGRRRHTDQRPQRPPVVRVGIRHVLGHRPDVAQRRRLERLRQTRKRLGRPVVRQAQALHRLERLFQRLLLPPLGVPRILQLFHPPDHSLNHPFHLFPPLPSKRPTHQPLHALPIRHKTLQQPIHPPHLLVFHPSLLHPLSHTLSIHSTTNLPPTAPPGTTTHPGTTTQSITHHGRDLVP